jgi:hypothetical protein
MGKFKTPLTGREAESGDSNNEVLDEDERMI